MKICNPCLYLNNLLTGFLDKHFSLGNAIATVKSNDSIKVITVRGTAFPAAGHQDAAAPHEDAPAVGQKDQSEFVSEHMQKSDRPELDSATRVIAGGRGMKSGENFGLLYDMADKIGAAGKQQDSYATLVRNTLLLLSGTYDTMH